MREAHRAPPFFFMPPLLWLVGGRVEGGLSWGGRELCRVVGGRSGRGGCRGLRGLVGA
jgi:hypothetical protein